MIDKELLDILACPEDKTPVKLADQATIDGLNTKIRQGSLKNRKGDAVSREIEAGLVRADGKFLYPVWDDIPVMLIEEAIPL
jgi:uncharacterized protein YbaR (Trm112 family)